MLHWAEDDWRGSPAGLSVAGGIVSGTKVATSMGWRPVEALCEGDLVLTFDRGLRPLVAVHRSLAPGAQAPRSEWPLAVPPGALGNAAPMMLASDQAVMLESDLAEGMNGDPFVLVAAAALEGIAGIDRCRPDAGFVSLVFDRDEVVFAQPGALLLCRAGGDLIADAFATDDLEYPVISGVAARVLVETLACA